MTHPDRTTKLLLLAIALGLWLNAINPWVQPAKAWADAEYALRQIYSSVSSMEGALARIR